VLLNVLGFLVGGYVLLLLGLAFLQRDMIYHPGKQRVLPDEVGLAEMVPVPLKAADGWIVTSWYAPPREPRFPTIVFFHGNAGTNADRALKARILLDAGYGVFLAEYRGFGGNPGRPTEKGITADAMAAMSWLVTRGIPVTHLALYGESLGSGVATRMAVAFPDVAALVLEAPFTRLPDMAPPVLPTALADLLMLDKYDNLARVPKLAMPLLIVHGERDSLVPPSMGRRLLAATDTIKESAFLPNAGHNDIWQQGGDTVVLDFLARRAKP
jgi:fermentation-respiration switch protein FrsA (DUF1100 family)